MPSRLLNCWLRVWSAAFSALASAASLNIGCAHVSLRRNFVLAPLKHRFIFARTAFRNPRVPQCTLRFLRARAAARGFTLIELLAAISILAVVAVLSWRGLDTIIRTRTSLNSALEQTRGMQLAFAQMQSDCGYIAGNDEIGRRQTLLAEPGRLTLVRTVFIENQPSRVQVVAYRLREGVLSRYESEATRDLRVLDALWSAAVSDANAGTSVALQSGVEGMDLRLWSAATGWRSIEAVIPPSAPVASAVPTGLEVTLRLAGNETGLVKVMLLGAI